LSAPRLGGGAGILLALQDEKAPPAEVNAALADGASPLWKVTPRSKT